MGVGEIYGCGWNLWVRLVGVVVRRYIYFLMLPIPIPLVSVLFSMFFFFVPVVFHNKIMY